MVTAVSSFRSVVKSISDKGIKIMEWGFGDRETVAVKRSAGGVMYHPYRVEFYYVT